MSYEKRNKCISAGATACCLAVLLLFLLLCGFTHTTPPPPPEEEVVVEVEAMEVFDLSGGGNMSEGGNSSPDNPTPAPDNPQPSKSSSDKSANKTYEGGTVSDNSGGKKEDPKSDKAAEFDMSKVGGTTSGSGAGKKNGDGLGYSQAVGWNGGTGGGTGGGSWKKIPDFGDLHIDRDFKFTVKCTVDDQGNVTNAVVTNSDGGAPASLVSEVRRRILNNAKFSPGHPGTYEVPFTLRKMH